MSHNSLFIHDSNIASREYAFHCSAFVASLCPIGIHEFRDEDAVIGQDSEIASI